MITWFPLWYKDSHAYLWKDFLYNVRNSWRAFSWVPRAGHPRQRPSFALAPDGVVPGPARRGNPPEPGRDAAWCDVTRRDALCACTSPCAPPAAAPRRGAPDVSNQGTGKSCSVFNARPEGPCLGLRSKGAQGYARFWEEKQEGDRRETGRSQLGDRSYTQYTIHYTPYTTHRILYTIYCTLYTLHYMLYTTHYTLYTIITLYTTHYTLYTIHYILHAIHYTLYLLYCSTPFYYISM